MRRQFLPFALIATAALAATPATAATATASTTVNVYKAVVISKLQDLDFGTLVISGFTGTKAIVMARTGVVTCATSIVCSGTTKQARFNVQGSNNQVVQLTVTGTTLSNGTDSIPFAPDSQSTITMINSGAPGINFDVGGTLTVSSTQVGGTYSGTINVTADY